MPAGGEYRPMMVNKMSFRRRSAAIGALLLALAGLLPAIQASALVRPVVVDSVTGFAIEGFDPLSYFTDGRPREGRAAHEAEWGGGVWRFANEGNRAAFVASPQTYAPVFGGHCPVALARGNAAEGSPLIWAMHEGRLFFFFSLAARQIFLDDPDTALAGASRTWSRLQPL